LQFIGFVLFEFVILAGVIMLTVASLTKSQGGSARRYTTILAAVSLVGLIVYYSVEVVEDNSLGAGLVEIVLLLFANVTLAVVVVQVCLYAAPYQRWSITIVDAGCGASHFSLWHCFVDYSRSCLDVCAKRRHTCSLFSVSTLGGSLM
jgi:hypothetical protein